MEASLSEGERQRLAAVAATVHGLLVMVLLAMALAVSTQRTTVSTRPAPVVP